MDYLFVDIATLSALSRFSQQALRTRVKDESHPLTCTRMGRKIHFYLPDALAQLGWPHTAITAALEKFRGEAAE